MGGNMAQKVEEREGKDEKVEKEETEEKVKKVEEAKEEKGGDWPTAGAKAGVQEEVKERMEQGANTSWRDVEWDEQRVAAARQVLEQEIEALTEEELADENEKQGEAWTKFYGTHSGQFFKPRNYLHVEYPELLPAICPCKARQMEKEEEEKATAEEESLEEEAGDTGKVAADGQSAAVVGVTESLVGKDADNCSGDARVYLEAGCGNGSTVFPLIAMHQSRTCAPVHFFAFDFAPSAVTVLKQHAEYDERTCTGFVCDVTKEDLVPACRQDAVDVAFMIFVLSAIEPSKQQAAMQRMYDSLKPGGVLILRDYGLYDMTQMRFVAKRRRKIADNFYMRADGTRTYFFSLEDVERLAKTCGFEVAELKLDTRELRNRKRKISMYRVWVKAKFVKPLTC